MKPKSQQLPAMKAKRLLVDPSCIADDEAVLQGALFHHVVRVLRLPVGAALVLTDGAGTIYEATIGRIGPDRVVARLGPATIADDDPPPVLTLVYGLARGARTELVWQKSTELGVGRIVPAICQRSVARPSQLSRKRDRWCEIVAQAARQCGRTRLPDVAAPLPLDDALASAASAEIRLIADPQGEHPVGAFAEALATPPAEVALAIGPEGGFTAAEVDTARALGFTAVSLGPLVLRTETSAIALLAIVAHLARRIP